MNIKTFFGKSVSIILCLSMLASFILMGTFSSSAEAVAGTYSFRVKWQCNNKGGSYKTGYSYDGNRTDNGKNYVGFTVFYRNVNGTGEELHVDKDLGGSMNNDTDDHWVEWTNTGFPTGLFAHNDHGNIFTDGEFKIKEIQVKKNGAADSEYKTVWTGTIFTDSSTDIKEAWFYIDGTHGTNDNSNAEASGTAWTSKLPKPSSVAFTTFPASTTVTAPKTGEANISLQYEATVYDQYNVSWYQPPSYSLTTAFDGVSITSTTGLVTVTSDAHSADGTDTTITIDAVSKSSKGSATLKVINAKYNYEFKNLAGETVSQGSLKYGSVIPLPANPTKPYEDDCHYNFSNWSANDDSWASSGNRIHMDTVLTPEFTPESHAFLHYYSDNNATCTHDGTKTATCSCGKTDTVTDKGSRLPHQYTEEIITPATCLEDGLLKYSCKNCDDSYTEVIEHTGHNYKYKVVEPTCTENGYSGDVCENCGDIINKVDIESPGHIWDEGTYTTEPTCTEPGEIVYTCTVCDETKTEKVEALGHSVKNWILDSEPTCTEPGLESGNCKTCHMYVEREIPALGHEFGEWVKDSDPTCDTEGISHRECSVCHYIDIDTVQPLGHEYELITVDPKTDYGEAVPGCYYYHCDVCNKYFTCEVLPDGSKQPGETGTSKSEAINNTTKIPTPEFNTYKRVESNFNYSKRGAALKIDSSNGENEQSMRFCASMLLPEGARVIDYGFVHTIVYTTMRKFVIGGDHVFDVSLINGNRSVFNTDEGTVYTFNLVIPVNKDNWDTNFYVRPYIKYVYANETFTVYDDVYSERSVIGVAEQVVASPFESDTIKNFFNSKIFGK